MFVLGQIIGETHAIPCHKVAQIGGESGTDSVSDRLIDSGVCVASRREQVCFALLFVCVCVCVCVRARGPVSLSARTSRPPRSFSANIMKIIPQP